MADTERLEAKGPRGEACIIIRTWAAPDTSNLGEPSDGRGSPAYRLATGERLRPTASPGVYETIDGKRQFTLR